MRFVPTVLRPALPVLLALSLAVAGGAAAAGPATDPAVDLAAGTPQPPIGAEAFEDYTAGRTLTYASHGLAYGIERYLRNRRVLWAFLDGTCHHGYWYPKGDEICFLYEDLPGEQCWLFRLSDGGLAARFADSGEDYDVLESGETVPLDCPGPMVGA